MRLGRKPIFWVREKMNPEIVLQETLTVEAEEKKTSATLPRGKTGGRGKDATSSLPAKMVSLRDLQHDGTVRT